MSSRGPYVGKRARTRRRLLRAGMVVIAERGLQGLNVAQVAGRAGVVPGTFYNYFDGTAALVSAIVEPMTRAIEQGVAGAPGGDNAAQRLGGVVRRLLAMAADDRLALRAFVRLVDEDARLERQVRELLAGLLAEGHRQGCFLVDGATPAVDAVLGLMRQAASSRLDGRTDSSVDDLIVDLVLRLVGTSALS